MGLSASQARFLSLTARQADCEARSMELAQNKLSITRDLADATQDYQNALNATTFAWDYNGEGDNLQALTYNLLMTPSAFNEYNPQLLTNMAGQVNLTGALANAAIAAGISKNGTTQPSEQGFQNFLNALKESKTIGSNDVLSSDKIYNTYSYQTDNGDNIILTKGNLNNVLNVVDGTNVSEASDSIYFTGFYCTAAWGHTWQRELNDADATWDNYYMTEDQTAHILNNVYSDGWSKVGDFYFDKDGNALTYEQVYNKVKEYAQDDKWNILGNYPCNGRQGRIRYDEDYTDEDGEFLKVTNRFGYSGGCTISQNNSLKSNVEAGWLCTETGKDSELDQAVIDLLPENHEWRNIGGAYYCYDTDKGEYVNTTEDKFSAESILKLTDANFDENGNLINLTEEQINLIETIYHIDLNQGNYTYTTDVGVGKTPLNKDAITGNSLSDLIDIAGSTRSTTSKSNFDAYNITGYTYDSEKKENRASEVSQTHYDTYNYLDFNLFGSLIGSDDATIEDDKYYNMGNDLVDGGIWNNDSGDVQSLADTVYIDGSQYLFSSNQLLLGDLLSSSIVVTEMDGNANTTITNFISTLSNYLTGYQYDSTSGELSSQQTYGYPILAAIDSTEELEAWSTALKKTISNFNIANSKKLSGVGAGDNLKDAAALMAEEYNTLIKYGSGDDINYAVSASNVLSYLLTQYELEVKGSGTSGYVNADTVEDSNFVTSDANYCYAIQDNYATTDETVLKTDFYAQLYNNLCTRGWTQNDNLSNKDYLEGALKNGSLFMTSLSGDGYYYQNRYTEEDCIIEVVDEDAIAQAEAEFETIKAKLTYKEEKIDLEMKNLDAEISEITTEKDSVKNLISKNVEKIFSLFQ